jgi:hypothetical protein
MKSARPAPPARLEGVATADPPHPVDCRSCERCGRPIADPRPKQRFCGSRCRWAAWKAGQLAATDRLRARDARVAGLLREALRALEEP